MKKFLLLAFVCGTIFSQSLKAQYYYYNDKYYDNAVVFELGGAFGVMNSLTDLGGKRVLEKNSSKT